MIVKKEKTNGSIPHRSNAERAEALAVARKVRTERGEAMKKLKSGELSASAVLERSSDNLFAKIKVKSFLMSVPSIGNKKAELIMSEMRLDPEKRIGGLGAKQKQIILELIEKYERSKGKFTWL